MIKTLAYGLVALVCSSAMAVLGGVLVDAASGVDATATGVGAGMFALGGAGAVLTLATVVAELNAHRSRARR